jgi:hypothetical protein
MTRIETLVNWLRLNFELQLSQHLEGHAMDMDAFHRQSALDQYKNFVQVCQQKGLILHVVPDDELEQLPLFELQVLVRQVRDLARTPS